MKGFVGMIKNWFSFKEILIMLIGLVITGLSFLCYFVFKKTLLDVTWAIVSLVFTIWLLFFVLRDQRQFSKIQNIIYPLIILLVFYGFVLALIVIINPLKMFSLAYLFWMIYLGAGIIPLYYFIIILLGLLSYGA